MWDSRGLDYDESIVVRLIATTAGCHQLELAVVSCDHVVSMVSASDRLSLA